MTFDYKMIENVYNRMEDRVANARCLTGKPLTLAEKILFNHLAALPATAPVRGETYVNLNPDRVAMQDATAQMALLQFMLAGKKETAVPSTVHCDHLLQAKLGAREDLSTALDVNKEVYDFLASVSEKYAIGFWGPGSGIIHQIVVENYAFPGGMMIGTDSHTPNAGGLGMIAIGVGGADAVDVMTGMPWELKWPKVIGVHLTGCLSGWASPKDVILKLAGILSVKGGTGAIVEYFGEGTQSISATGKATITNMGAEVGATTSVFPFDDRTYQYLEATDRRDVAERALKIQDNLQADSEVLANPEQFYDRIVEINLSELEPHVVGPFTPDLDRPISQMKQEAAEKNYPTELKAALIGSCTNSSYEDLSRAAHIAKSALAQGLKAKSKFYISPGSEQIRATIERDGILETLEALGGTVLTNSCGPCIGQWDRQDFKKEEPNSIITSFNRNFRARNDGNPETLAFIGSPELVTAQAIAGCIDFDPQRDTVINDKGEEILLEAPKGADLPPQGFIDTGDIYTPPTHPSEKVDVVIQETSARLQRLEPFAAWNGEDTLDNCVVLLKARGKCTTDHVSPAGKWLKYRGHLDNISDNLYIGATNAFCDQVGHGNNLLTGEESLPISEIGRQYKEQGQPWIVIADENYGEGSSREHAAMEPRHLGCVAVIARSFARIAENNLKKQGVLVAAFANPEDYEKILPEDRVTITGLSQLAPKSPLQMLLKHKDGTTETLVLKHSFSDYQTEWFRAGSALNLIRQKTSG